MKRPYPDHIDHSIGPDCLVSGAGKIPRHSLDCKGGVRKLTFGLCARLEEALCNGSARNKMDPIRAGREPTAKSHLAMATSKAC